MRGVEISSTEYWMIPDKHIVVPAYDLFLDHYDSEATDGMIDTLILSGVTYISVFFDGVARFYVGEELKFNAVANKTYSATLDPDGVAEEIEFTIWSGISRDARQLPEVLFSEDNFLSLVPAEIPESFCVDCDGIREETEDTIGITIDYLYGTFATVWLGSAAAIPAGAKTVRVLPVCEGDKKVNFILQNGEQRTWFLHVKRKTASYKELTAYNKVLADITTLNESTYEISDGENEILTTLFVSGLRKNELDEISQLAVSRYVNIDGIRAEIVRRSAVISGNASGGTFSIDVKNMI